MKQDEKLFDKHDYDKLNGCVTRKEKKEAKAEIAGNKLVIKADGPKQHSIKTDVSHAAISSAESGAIIAAMTATVTILVACWRRQINVAEASRLIFRETIQGGAKSAMTNVLSIGTKHVLFRSGAAHLARSHAPVAIATTCIAASTAIYKDVKKCNNGEVTKRKVLINGILHILRSAIRTCITIATGGVGGAFGATYGQVGTIVGATIGATVGYIGSGKIIEFITMIADVGRNAR